MGSRMPLVAMLVAVEIAIVGIAVYALTGHHTIFASGTPGFDGFRQVNYTAPSFAPLAVGSGPTIAIDDPSDRVIVTASNDRFVHVVDRTQVRGNFWGSPHIAPLRFDRNANGVTISRAEDSEFVGFGFESVTRRIEVQVPSDAALAIARCGGAEVSGVTGGVTAHSVDGSILLADLHGAVDVRDDDGRIEARRIVGDTFSARSNDGRIILDGVVSPKIDVNTLDGRIIATFPSDSDATIMARTNDGNIIRDGTLLNHGDGDAASQTLTLGSGSAKVAMATDDGTITIFTNGAN
jgi:hypothetical protein